jgi:hypothetical protein
MTDNPRLRTQAVGTVSLRRTLELWVADHKRKKQKSNDVRRRTKCEDCLAKVAQFRLGGASEGRRGSAKPPRRWCPGCAQDHPGAVFAGQVRKAPSWPRSWANLSLF